MPGGRLDVATAVAHGSVVRPAVPTAPSGTEFRVSALPPLFYARMDSLGLKREVIRMLLYVAWADGEIAPQEYDFILRMARNADLSSEDVAAFDRAMRDPTNVEPPDVEALKPLRQEVLSAAQELIECDDDVAPAETEMLHRIASLLSD